MNEKLLDNADKYGLSKIKCSKIFTIKKPLQINIDDKIFLIEDEDYIKDINFDLYDYLANEFYNGNELYLRLSKNMISNIVHQQFEKYNGKDINLSNLKNEIKSFKNIVYNPITNDKFIGIIDIDKCFIHIYEFINENKTYKAKYIHAKIDIENNIIKHLDYSMNTYTEEQYKDIIANPNEIPKSDKHRKIWRLDGFILLENFYNIIFCMYDKNEKYIKELFKI